MAGSAAAALASLGVPKRAKGVRVSVGGKVLAMIPLPNGAVHAEPCWTEEHAGRLYDAILIGLHGSEADSNSAAGAYSAMNCQMEVARLYSYGLVSMETVLASHKLALSAGCQLSRSMTEANIQATSNRLARQAEHNAQLVREAQAEKTASEGSDTGGENFETDARASPSQEKTVAPVDGHGWPGSARFAMAKAAMLLDPTASHAARVTEAEEILLRYVSYYVVLRCGVVFAMAKAAMLLDPMASHAARVTEAEEILLRLQMEDEEVFKIAVAKVCGLAEIKMPVASLDYRHPQALHQPPTSASPPVPPLAIGAPPARHLPPSAQYNGMTPGQIGHAVDWAPPAVPYKGFGEAQQAAAHLAGGGVGGGGGYLSHAAKQLPPLARAHHPKHALPPAGTSPLPAASVARGAATAMLSQPLSAEELKEQKLREQELKEQQLNDHLAQQLQVLREARQGLDSHLQVMGELKKQKGQQIKPRQIGPPGSASPLSSLDPESHPRTNVPRAAQPCSASSIHPSAAMPMHPSYAAAGWASEPYPIPMCSSGVSPQHHVAGQGAHGPQGSHEPHHVAIMVQQSQPQHVPQYSRAPQTMQMAPRHPGNMQAQESLSLGARLRNYRSSSFACSAAVPVDIPPLVEQTTHPVSSSSNVCRTMEAPSEISVTKTGVDDAYSYNDDGSAVNPVAFMNALKEDSERWK
eukprot:gene8587-34029_t